MTVGLDLDVWPDVAPPASLTESGLTLEQLLQLLVKHVQSAGELAGVELAARLGLAFPVIEPGVDAMKAQRLCEIVGGASLGPPSYRYRITQLGREHADKFRSFSAYTGIAPVSLTSYLDYMRRYRRVATRAISRGEIRAAFSHLVLDDRILDQIGPAVNAGHSLFVYGPPGNGKTVIAQAIRDALPGDIWIPFAIDVDGSLIQVFDPVNHEAVPVVDDDDRLDVTPRYDRRWIRCRRPMVMVGGELTLEHLDLTRNPAAGFYRAPVQLVANGGVLVVDDFGRQQCSPQAILNRWITPLESRTDHLTLQSGQKVGLPFDLLLVFATNIRPSELVDEAFLRRIHYKVAAENPTEEAFHQIFERCCRERGIPYSSGMVDDLLERVYPARNVSPRCCQPRDLIEQALALALYRGEPRRLTTELLEAACATYFVDEDQGVSRG